MKPHAKRIARLAFWIVFLTAAGVTGWQIWVRLDPLRNHPAIAPWWLQRQVDGLSSSHRETAVRAWNELERCYLTKWSAYDWVVWRIKENIWRKDDPPIHFHLGRSGNRYHATPGMPGPDCRTVTDALMAMVHQDPLWKTPYAGDWRRWWEANWTYYPNRHMPGKPSGPEDPGSRRRR